MMDELFQSLKNVALAGVGAVAIAGETVANVATDLVRKGEEVVEKAKQANEELRRNRTPDTDDLAEQAAKLTPEEREQLIAQLQEMDQVTVERINEDGAVIPEDPDVPEAPEAPAAPANPEEPGDA